MAATYQVGAVCNVQEVAGGELEEGEEDFGDVEEHAVSSDCLSCNLNEAKYFDTAPSLGVGTVLRFDKGYLQK